MLTAVTVQFRQMRAFYYPLHSIQEKLRRSLVTKGKGSILIPGENSAFVQGAIGPWVLFFLVVKE